MPSQFHCTDSRGSERGKRAASVSLSANRTDPEAPASQCGFQEPCQESAQDGASRAGGPSTTSHPPFGRQPRRHGRQGGVPDSLALNPKLWVAPHHPCALAPFQWLF